MLKGKCKLGQTKEFLIVKIADNMAHAYLTDKINPVALRKAKIVYNFGLSECNRVKHNTTHHIKILQINKKVIGRIPFERPQYPWTPKLNCRVPENKSNGWKFVRIFSHFFPNLIELPQYMFQWNGTRNLS